MSNATGTPAEQPRCLRCGRKIRATASLKAQYGGGCRAAIRREAREHALDGLNGRQRDEAIEIVADGGVIPSAHKGVWLVTSGDGSQVYRTTPAGQCNCKWGLKNLAGRPCKHVGAVRLVQVTSRRSMAKAA